MAWIKRNVFTLVLLSLLLCAITAFALETRSVPVPDSGGFRNNEPAEELAQSWSQAQNLCEYDLALTLDPDNKVLTGTLDFNYVNTEDRAMSELHFLLYANSHEKAHYGIFHNDEMQNAYPNGFSPGSTQILSVASGKSPLEHAVTGEQNHVLQVKLPQPVPPGGQQRVRIEYSVHIPNSYGRFGYGENTMSLVNCHPILSVYEDGRWHDYPYYSVGDPFYSETADYTATITAPRQYTIAATGLVNMRSAGQDTLWTVEAPARRDFGFVASDDFAVRQGTVDGVLVRSYYYKGQKPGDSGALETAMESIDLFNDSFGPYPYAEYSVVQCDFFIGGMEYPGMVLIDQSLYPDSLTNDVVLDLVVSHETAHQWWYATVGNDEVMNPWLDEGLTEFSTQYFFEKMRGERFNSLYAAQMEYMRDARQEVQTQGEHNYAVTLPSYAYGDNSIYSAWVYDRTAAMLRELRTDIGDEAFFSALRSYYSDNRLGIVRGEEFIKAFEKASGKQLADWFRKRADQTE